VTRCVRHVRLATSSQSITFVTMVVCFALPYSPANATCLSISITAAPLLSSRACRQFRIPEDRSGLLANSLPCRVAMSSTPPASPVSPAPLDSPTAPTLRAAQISSPSFYSEYYGHLVTHLAAVHAGDSTLDNKHYLPHSSHPAVNCYEKILVPPLSRGDVAHWLNVVASSRSPPMSFTQSWAALNCAVEESRVAPRAAGALLPQDMFVRDNITPRDTLVVCVGGNDVALAPTMATALNMMLAVWLNGRGSSASPPSPVSSSGWGMKHFVDGVFRRDIERYIASLTSVQKPRAVAVCMVYHPCVAHSAERGWADGVLRMLGYDSAPWRLQRVIDGVYRDGVCNVQVPGVETVVPVALSTVMDGTNEALYEARVEPSELGAKVIAEFLAKKLVEAGVL
jgi:hypothetical protein